MIVFNNVFINVEQLLSASKFNKNPFGLKRVINVSTDRIRMNYSTCNLKKTVRVKTLFFGNK